MERSRVVVIGMLMATLGAGEVRAEGLEWQVVDVVPGEPSERVPRPPPSIKVRVVGESAPSNDARDSWRLELDPADNPRRLRSVAPSAVVPYARSSDSLAVVVLVEGHQYYFGNDQYVLADGIVDGMIQKRSTGVYNPIVAALDQMGTINENSASKGGLIVYSVGSDVRQPLGPLGDLTGDKLGAQELQRGKTSRELAEGLRASLAQLRGVTATRKVLFVISDGFDAGGLDDIRALRRQFDAEQIDIFAFHFEAPTQFIPVNDGEQQRNRQAMQALGNNGNGAYWSVRDGDGLSRRLGEAIAKINARFYLIFPGQVTDPRTRVTSGFDWDGKERAVRLLRDDEPVSDRSIPVVFMPVWGQVEPASRLWMWIVFPLGGLVLVGGVVMLLSRKKAPAPQPVPLPVTAAAAAPPPQAPSIQPVAGGANATIAINLNSGDGVPVVGWLVPINGPQQFQTLKLFAGVTKVGNAQGAHIIIQDAFMSGEHAHVVMSPSGFTLVDNGSTNGTFVNERRVQRHELIDNDVIKFGKTDCKFKTINTDA